MMPDIVVQSQPARTLPSRNSSASKTVKVAMQKAANQSDSAAQVASQAAGSPQQKAPTEKSAEQPVQFFDLLMAQIEAPTEAIILPTQAPESANLNTQQSLQSEVQLAAFSSDQPVQSDAQVVVTQSLTSATLPTPQVTVQSSPATGEPVLPTAETPKLQTVASPVAPQTRPEVSVAALPQTQQPSPAPGQEQATTPNSTPVVAQTVVESTVKNTTQASGVAPEIAPQVVRKAHETAASAPESAANGAEKVTLAQIFAARMASKPTTKQTLNVSRTDLSAEATSPVTQAPGFNSASLLQGSQAGITSGQQDFTANLIASSQTAAPQTAGDTAASLRFLANQVAEGVRSAIGSDRTVTISLNPPELGRVLIRLQDDNGAVNAVLKVENPVTRADIEQSLPSIVRSLEQSGIQVRRMDVLPSDPVPQESSFGRQYDTQGGMPNQRDPQNNSSAQTGSAAGNSWQDLQPAPASATPVSTISDSAINIYM
jgi:flagellar hook-length control protein FliK